MPSFLASPRPRHRAVRRRVVASALVILIAAAGLVGVQTIAGPSETASASGSASLTAVSGACDGSTTARCRANIEWRTSAYGPTGAGEARVARRTLFSVYLQPGETLNLGSSSLADAANQTNSSDIVVWTPGQITDTQAATLPSPSWSCVTQRGTSYQTGYIKTRPQEVAGAQSSDGTVNTAGYVPCTYSVPANGTGGIFNVGFYGTDGASSDVQAAPTGNITPTNGTFPRYASNVAAWDLTVRPTSATAGPTSDITGRVFTYAISAYTGNNPRPTYLALYLNTLDGYRYAVDTKGFDPNGFVFYGNDTGFLDADGSPLNHDIVGNGPIANPLASIVGGAHFSAPQYPLSFEPLSAVTLQALGIPTTPIAPVLNSISYTGTKTATSSYEGKGGTFTVNTGTAGTYQIVISKNGTDYDPGDPANRVLRGKVGSGSSQIAWDGLSNSRTAMPASATSYPVQAILRAGEYHAPMIDVESSINGGPSIALVNPPASTCPFTNAASNGSNCTTAFYDDRGYTTSTKQAVGVPGGSICPANSADFAGTVPNPDHSDVGSGFDSSSSQRSFGLNGNSNRNVACPTDANAKTTLGDAKGLDLWTFFPSTTRSTALTVVATPAAPVATDDTATTVVGTPITTTATTGVLANDSGSSLTAGGASAPAHGTVALASDGSYVYTPQAGYSGTDSFTYTATDEAGQTSPATVRISITPTGTADTASTAANTTLTVPARGVLANDSGSALTAALNTTAAHGTVTLASDGSYTYVPETGFSGTDTFTYRATDGAGQRTAPVQVTITVTPTAVDDAYTVPYQTRTSVAAAQGVLANDIGSQTTAAGPLSGPTHGTVSVARDGSFVYTPADGYSGPDAFTYRLTDGSGQTQTATARLTVLPDAVRDSYTTPYGTTLTVPAKGVLANDGGSGIQVDQVTRQPAHGSVTVQPDGSFVYTPMAGYSGGDIFGYRIKDSSGGTDIANATIQIAPQGADDAYSTTAGGTLTVASPGVLDNDAGSGLTATKASDPQHGSLTLRSNGGFTYLPDDGFSGVDTFTYDSTDDSGQSNRQTVSITVTPVAVADTGAVVAGATLTVDAASGVLVNDHGTGLQATVSVQPEHGVLTLATDGSYSYVPDAGFSGTDSFIYRATDANGRFSRATVTLTVRPTAVDDSGTTPADQALRVLAPGVLSNDLGTGLSAGRLSDPAHGSVALDSTGSWVYTPAKGFSGTDSFTYRATDGEGRTSAPATVTITVTPVAVDDAILVDAGGTATADAAHGLLADDSGSSLAASGPDQGYEPQHGTLALAADGSYTYVPDAGYSGPDSFRYTATDGEGRTSQATVTVTVRPVAVDDNPSVDDPAFRTTIDQPLTLTAPGVLANDLATSPTLVAVTSQPAHGTLTANADGSFTYAPASGYTGLDSFGYRLRDASGQESAATVTLDVRPAGQDDAFTTRADTTLDVDAADGVLSNDAGTGLSATVRTDVLHGTLQLNTDGSFRYVPDAGFSGVDPFVYTATDDQGQSVDQTATITVRPVVRDRTATVDASGPTSVPASTGLLAGDSGSDLAATGPSSGPAHGTVQIAPDGGYTYTPAAGFSGQDTFSFTVTDGSGQSQTATATVTVKPVARPDQADAAAGTSLTVLTRGVLANDSGSNLTAALATPPAHGSVSLAADGSYTYVPDAGFSGDDAFDYVATDDTGRSTAPVTVSVTVHPAAISDSRTVSTGGATAFPKADGVLVNDSGTDLTASGPVTPPAHGTATVGADGSFSYRPDDGFSGEVSFTYRATDGTGTTSTGTVLLTVLPVAVADSRTTALDTPVTVPARGLLANDLGSGLSVVTVITAPQHGTVAVNPDGSYTYAPASGFSGTDTFRYLLQDASGGTADALVTIGVGLAALPDAFDAVAGRTLSGAAANVLANDGGSAVTVTSFTQPVHGAVAVDPDGQVRYTPADGFSGDDSFRYTITDAAGQTATATATIAVAPAAVDDRATTPANRTLRVAASGLLGNDRGTGLHVVSAGTPSHGTATVDPDGSYVYTPTTGFYGTDQLPYTIADAAGRQSSAVLTIIVPQPQAVVTAVDDRASGVAGAAVRFDPAANDVAGDGLTLDRSSVRVIDPTTGEAVTKATVRGQGTWTVNPDGTVTFQPQAGYLGTATIRYAIDNSAGQQAMGVLSVVVYATTAALLAHTGSSIDAAFGLALLLLLVGLALVLIRLRPWESSAALRLRALLGGRDRHRRRTA